MITDGYTTGLHATLWATGYILGTLTLLTPWTLAAWLLYRAADTIADSRPAWRIRAWRSTRRRGRMGD